MSTQSPFRSNIKFIRPVQEIQKIYYTTQIKTIIYKACTKKNQPNNCNDKYIPANCMQANKERWQK